MRTLQKVKKLCWYVDNRGYAQNNNYKNEHIRLHRFILNPPANAVIDHINHNKLDNRKENLRIVSHQQNQFNRKMLNKNNTSGYNGIYFNKQCKKWCAQITINGKTISAGLFINITDAIKARKKLENRYCQDGIDYEIVKRR